MLSSVLMAYWGWLNNSLNHMHYVDNIVYSLQKFAELVMVVNEYQLCIYINICTLKQKSFITTLLALDINNWCTIYMQGFKVIRFWQCQKSRVFIVIMSRATSSSNFCRLCECFSTSMLKIRNLPISKLADILKTNTSPFKIPNTDVDSNII